MENELILQTLVKDLNFVKSIYEIIRLVDPIRKEVYYCSKSTKINLIDSEQKCYSLWQKGLVCENCISMRAKRFNKIFDKIEYMDSMIFFITAVPVDNDGEIVVVELVKDITNDGIIDVDGMEIGQIDEMIKQKNGLIVRDAFIRIYNEKFIYERLPYDIYKSKEENRKLTLFYLSIENLKSINNKFGYKAVNYVMKEFSKFLKNYTIKENDWSARYSGTEFVMLLFDIDEKQAYRICKRINDKINKNGIIFEDHQIKIDIHLGFYILNSEDLTVNQFILAASKSIYHTSDIEENNKSAITKEEIFQKYVLTEREKEVAALLLKGYKNSEIAKELFIGISTVKKHIVNIFDKSNVKSRAEFIYKCS